MELLFWSMVGGLVGTGLLDIADSLMLAMGLGLGLVFTMTVARLG